MGAAMDPRITGLHHVTAITASAQRNLDFYAGVLGLRLVKLTVNADDPTTYHLVYGDELGRPGSLLTFFAWPGAYHGCRGTGQVGVTALSVPAASGGYWKQRLGERGVPFAESAPRHGEPVIRLSDPDGLRLELVAADDPRPAWADGPVPPQHAVRGLHSITLAEEEHAPTAALLTGTLGFRPVAGEAGGTDGVGAGGLGGDGGSRFRYAAGDARPGSIVDVLCVPGAPRGTMGPGAVHHVAWRTDDDEQQCRWRAVLADKGHNVSPLMDRHYFHSIYFREPGGVLFEIATDPPGFTADEPPGQLGRRLMLPPWAEPQRPKLQFILPPLRLPGEEVEAGAQYRAPPGAADAAALGTSGNRVTSA